jgi:polyisoprenoid-binding protein YceI
MIARRAMYVSRPGMSVAALAAAVFIAASAPTVRAADVYDLDQSHFSIVFSVSHMGMSYTYGIFRQAQARVTLDRENPSATQFQMTINAESIDTNNDGRDKHLKGPDFFDATTYPAITFQSTTVVPVNEPKRVVYQVTGNIQMHGVTRQLTLPIELLGEGTGPDGKPHAGFVTQFELKRSDFGMTKFLENNMVGDAIGITVSFEGIQQAAGAAPPR